MQSVGFLTALLLAAGASWFSGCWDFVQRAQKLLADQGGFKLCDIPESRYQIAIGAGFDQQPVLMINKPQSLV